MPRQKKKPTVSLWNIKHAEAVGIAGEIKRKKDLIVPFVSLIMRADKTGLEAEYKKYLKHDYPLMKLSSEKWIDSFAAEWTELKGLEDSNQLFMDRLNGIEDKANWDGKNPPLEDSNA